MFEFRPLGLYRIVLVRVTSEGLLTTMSYCTSVPTSTGEAVMRVLDTATAGLLGTAAGTNAEPPDTSEGSLGSV